MLTEFTNRLKLKDKDFQTQSPCTKEEIEKLWEIVHEIDPTVQRTDSRQAQLKSRTRLHTFHGALLHTAAIHVFHQEMWRRVLPILQAT